MPTHYVLGYLLPEKEVGPTITITEKPQEKTIQKETSKAVKTNLKKKVEKKIEKKPPLKKGQPKKIFPPKKPPLKAKNTPKKTGANHA